jgi:class 3 adenylate cyclase
LPVVCPACDTVNQPSEDFCGGCGKTLAQVAAPPARRRQVSGPERRQLTVMFCDLVGSTALSHELDPEDLREVIRSYQEGTRHVIARYEGFVARYMGDGMLAYFGYPQAHEDDAARAIHAGLEIAQAPDLLDALPTREGVWRPRVRIGIATGLVVVGDLIGEGASEEAAAVGETPNLAARLQTLAEPGSVLVAERTRELAGGRFEYADRGTHELKGFDRPVRAWRVLRTSAAESRFDSARTRRMTPFIGRAEEIDLLLGRWRRATEGEGQVVLLVGEAGIGKSRIAETLVERIADEPHIRLRYQCSPYHANSALYPFIQQLERAADFGRGDTAEQKLDKLEALLAKSTPDSGESAPLFAALLSLPAGGRYPALPLTPQQQKQKTFVALLERFRGFAAQAPVFMLLEDVHWIDPTSIEFLDLLARHVRDLPVLVIVTSRVAADYAWLGLQHVTRSRWNGWIPAVREHGEATPGKQEAACRRDQQIVAKTDGVPLFIEEFTKTLATSDAVREGEASPQAVRSEIPSTLHDSLMARLDRLGAAKEVAQVGAVIGREFSRDLVAALSPVGEPELGEALDRLTSSAVVFGRGQPPWTAFIFKHALVQDAAYASLLRSKRQELHRASRRPSKAAIGAGAHRTGVVAHHYAQAGRACMRPDTRQRPRCRLDRSANVEALVSRRT